VPVTGCDPLAPQEMAPIVESAAKAQDVPAKLVRAVIAQESGFRPCAESKKGAMGLMQLMPATAEQLDVAEPFDAQSNVEGGAKYLRQLLERYKGDLRLALAAYNAGPAAVDAAGGVPDIPETRVYVNAILGVLGIKQIDLPSIPTPKPIGN
jgi:soluble lytic murein transglycosylase-like protein